MPTVKNEVHDFKKHYRTKYNIPYSSGESLVIRNKFPSDIGNDTTNLVVKFVIITQLGRSQNSMAVIFLMIQWWGFTHTLHQLTRLQSERD
jgi:hypothetical protein